MRFVCLCAALGVLLPGGAAYADQIAADRPGVGVDVDVVPQFTIQAEVGTDSREVRLGVLKGLELERDDHTWGAKLALINNGSFQLSVRGTRDDSRTVGFELPASLMVNHLFYVTTDVIWTREAQVYAAEFNLTPTTRLTITPVVYYDTKARLAFNAAWVPKGHDSLQFDIGYDQNKVSVGISKAFDLRKLVR